MKASSPPLLCTVLIALVVWLSLSTSPAQFACGCHGDWVLTPSPSCEIEYLHHGAWEQEEHEHAEHVALDHDRTWRSAEPSVIPWSTTYDLWRELEPFERRLYGTLLGEPLPATTSLAPLSSRGPERTHLQGIVLQL